MRVDNSFTDWFQTVVGVLQGCVLSPLLFCIFLEIVMARALDDENLGAIVSGSIVSNLKFADDIGLLSESADDLQTLIDRAQAESSRFGLTISTAKTEVQCISPLEHDWTSTIDGVPLRRAKEFVYLGGKMTEAADSKADVDRTDRSCNWCG